MVGGLTATGPERLGKSALGAPSESPGTGQGDRLAATAEVDSVRAGRLCCVFLRKGQLAERDVSELAPVVVVRRIAIGAVDLVRKGTVVARTCHAFHAHAVK